MLAIAIPPSRRRLVSPPTASFFRKRILCRSLKTFLSLIVNHHSLACFLAFFSLIWSVRRPQHSVSHLRASSKTQNACMLSHHPATKTRSLAFNGCSMQQCDSHLPRILPINLSLSIGPIHYHSRALRNGDTRSQTPRDQRRRLR